MKYVVMLVMLVILATACGTQAAGSSVDINDLETRIKGLEYTVSRMQDTIHDMERRLTSVEWATGQRP